VQGVGSGQQRDILGAKAPGKALGGAAIALVQRLAPARAAQQARELGTRVTAGAQQIGAHHPFVSAPQAGIVHALEHGADEGVTLRILATGLELHLGAALQKAAQLRNAPEFRFVHVDHHDLDDRSKH